MPKPLHHSALRRLEHTLAKLSSPLPAFYFTPMRVSREVISSGTSSYYCHWDGDGGFAFSRNASPHHPVPLVFNMNISHLQARFTNHWTEEESNPSWWRLWINLTNKDYSAVYVGFFWKFWLFLSSFLFQSWLFGFAIQIWLSFFVTKFFSSQFWLNK